MDDNNAAPDNYDNAVCLLCGDGGNEQVLLLCDGCDKGFHTYCMNLPAIPVGAWYCPGCRRKSASASASAELMPGLGDDFQQTPKGQVHPGLGVFLYERVSSKGQNEPEYGRVGMDTQNNALLEFALQNGLVVRGTAREVHSARDPSKLTQVQTICRMIRARQFLQI